MKTFSRRNLYLLLIILLLGLLTTVVYAANLDVDTFEVDAQFSDVGTPCTSVGGGTGTDMLGGERDLEVVRTSGGSTVEADVDTFVTDSLAFSIGAGTRGTALIQLDGADGDCTLSFGLAESLDPNDGLTIFVQQVDLNAVVSMRVYTDGSNYSEYNDVLPYAISAPGFELYFPFDQFTDTGSGADFTSVAAIEVLLDGTTIDSLDMTIDYISSDFTRDYGDLPATYTNTLEIDNGARHQIGAVYLGPSVDSEADGQESADATGDAARSDDENGITLNDGDWGDGMGAVLVDITKPTAVTNVCVVGWIDWDGDGIFESTATVGVTASELVVNNFVSADGNVTFTTPTQIDYGGAYPSTLNARFRIFRLNEPLFATFGIPLDPFGCPTSFGTATPAQVTQLVFGDATDGEVEDYQWGFSPTAITLSNATTNNQQTGLVLVIGLIGAGFVITTSVIRRRQKAEILTKE